LKPAAIGSVRAEIAKNAATGRDFSKKLEF
jgi:hypothetical protein